MALFNENVDIPDPLRFLSELIDMENIKRSGSGMSTFLLNNAT